MRLPDAPCSERIPPKAYTRRSLRAIRTRANPGPFLAPDLPVSAVRGTCCIEVVRYPIGPEWYTRLTYEGGATLHSEPWLSHTAAVLNARIWRNRWVAELRRQGVGDGDVCPLFADHGQMLVMQGTRPPMQWCPHQMHDGSPSNAPGGKVAPSRNRWPLHGFEDSVRTYNARLDRAIREAGLPDLSDVEVL